MSIEYCLEYAYYRGQRARAREGSGGYFTAILTQSQVAVEVNIARQDCSLNFYLRYV
jgi:hypothetical protein